MQRETFGINVHKQFLVFGCFGALRIFIDKRAYHLGSVNIMQGVDIAAIIVQPQPFGKCILVIFGLVILEVYRLLGYTFGRIVVGSFLLGAGRICQCHHTQK